MRGLRAGARERVCERTGRGRLRRARAPRRDRLTGVNNLFPSCDLFRTEHSRSVGYSSRLRRDERRFPNEQSTRRSCSLSVILRRDVCYKLCMLVESHVVERVTGGRTLRNVLVVRSYSSERSHHETVRESHVTDLNGREELLYVMDQF